MDVPKDIEKYLVKNETIEKEFKLRGLFGLTGPKVYASNKRLFIKQGDSIRDIDYNHVSSIALKQARNLLVIFLGLIFLAGSAVVLWMELSIGWVLVAVGIILFILGLIKTKSLEISVVGLLHPQKLSGYLTDLDSLFKIIREKNIEDDSI
jgi:hypothetical protein